MAINKGKREEEKKKIKQLTNELNNKQATKASKSGEDVDGCGDDGSDGEVIKVC
jgi:hypothetical protein